jgi:hypothetical protein
MHPANHRVATILLVSVLLLTMAASASFYVSRLQAIALAGSQAGLQTLPEKPEVVSDTQNNITVEMTAAKVISTGVEIGICYTTPDNGEWRPMPGHLFYGIHEVYPDEIEFLENEILADEKTPGRRCALIRYRIDDPSALVTPIEFSILQFYAPGREMYTPCEELQQRLNTSPKAQAYRLKVECTETGDGSTSVKLVDYDPSVTEFEASQTLNEVAKAEVDGLWKFTIDELER